MGSWTKPVESTNIRTLQSDPTDTFGTKMRNQESDLIDYRKPRIESNSCHFALKHFFLSGSRGNSGWKVYLQWQWVGGEEAATCLWAITSHILVNCCLWNLKEGLGIRNGCLVSVHLRWTVGAQSSIGNVQFAKWEVFTRLSKTIPLHFPFLDRLASKPLLSVSLNWLWWIFSF